MKAAFIALPRGTYFIRDGDTSIYRKLDGVSFECVRVGSARTKSFQAFAEVEIFKGNTEDPLVALARRVARLNPDAGEIGPGMLASLVEDARQALASAGVDA